MYWFTLNLTLSENILSLQLHNIQMNNQFLYLEFRRTKLCFKAAMILQYRLLIMSYNYYWDTFCDGNNDLVNIPLFSRTQKNFF